MATPFSALNADKNWSLKARKRRSETSQSQRKKRENPQRLGVSEKETVFVGDTVDADIVGAKSIRYFAD